MTAHGQERGFTLLEVLVAMFILIIGIIAAMQLLPQSLLQARIAAERSMGAQIARNVFGSIRAADAESLSSGALERYDLEIVNQGGLLNLDRVEDLTTSNPVRPVNATHFYGYQTIIQPMTGSEETHLHKVTLVIDFNDGRSETYVTYVSKL